MLLLLCRLGLAGYFVKKLVTAAMDGRGREREAASALLSSLYGEVLPPSQILAGFLALAEAVRRV